MSHGTTSAGRSYSLSGGALNAVADDNGANWCFEPFNSYNGDFGTPGSANPDW